MSSHTALDHDTNGTDAALKRIIGDTLGLSADRVARIGPETGLFGHMAELDSMAAAALLTEVEDRLGIVIEDDEVDGDMMETYGALLAFVRAKRARA